jgi:diguanylate cyclase (GGDEF)-like protein
VPLAQQPHLTPEILIVDDDQSMIRLLSLLLAEEGNVRFATNGAEALRLARALPPDLILLDGSMPGMSGFEVCAELKRDPEFAEIPLIFVTAHRDERFEIAGFAAGASDFIAKPISPPILRTRVKNQLRLKRMADELQRNATVDALTGIANRRRFDEMLEREWARVRRGSEPLSLIMIDVDHFKLFNDCYGHPAGDAALRAIAQTLSAACRRPADLVARYGGEEFALMLPQTPAAGARQVAERLMALVQELSILHETAPTSRVVTLSAGIATYAGTGRPFGCVGRGTHPPANPDLATEYGALVQAADRALYAAKNAGRARYILVEFDADTKPKQAPR